MRIASHRLVQTTVTMKRLFLTLCTVVLALAGWAVSRDNYTVIISLDGFRWDYPEAFDTPFLDQMAHEGVKAVMTPSFPSKTFPNHYTLATGLVPDHHGIISNNFVVRKTGKVYSLGNKEMRNDPQYYGGDPVWLTAKRQGVTTATIFWVGSDVAVDGDHANYWHDYQKEHKELTYDKRCDEIVRLLSLPEAERPHLVMAYFDDPDAAGHRNGPICRATRQAMEDMDLRLDVLWRRIQMLPIAAQVNFIVTGDHGMTWLDKERQILSTDYLDSAWVESMYNDFPVLINATRPMYVDSIVNALQGVDHLRVWRRGQVPAYLNYGNNPNMSDVIVLPDIGWLFGDKEQLKKKDRGSHGYDNTMSDMWVAFRAMGPDFKRGYERRGTFRNVCIYPLLCHLLCVSPSANDGSLGEVSDLLK